MGIWGYRGGDLGVQGEDLGVQGWGCEAAGCRDVGCGMQVQMQGAGLGCSDTGCKVQDVGFSSSGVQGVGYKCRGAVI